MLTRTIEAHIKHKQDHNVTLIQTARHVKVQNHHIAG